MKRIFSTLTFLVFLQVIIQPGEAFAVSPPKNRPFPPGFWQKIGQDSNRLRYGNPGWVKKMKQRRAVRQKMAQGTLTLQSLQTDKFVIPVLLGAFSNEEGTYTADNFRDLLFRNNPAGTLRDYYAEVSYGQFSLSGPVAGWFRASQKKSFYAEDNYGMNYNFPRSTEGFVTEIVARADSTTDFSLYDNDGPDGTANSGDDDGYVDGVIVVYAGAMPDQSDSISLWPSQSSLFDEYITDDPSASGGLIKVSTYAVVPELRKEGRKSTINPIGMFAHEFGHILGLPDLYDRTGFSDYPDFDYSYGLGSWCLMAIGAEGGDGEHPEKPSHLSAWCKIQLGWITPVLVDQNGTIAIGQAETNPEAYMIWEDGYRLSRYFLVENRQKVGFDTYLPGSGLLIYHVDENRTWGPKDFFWGAMNDIETHKFVDLEEADGKDDLDNLNNTGDAGDVFPGASGNRSFDDNSIPDSRDYENRPTGVEIKKISISGSTMTAEITVRNPVGYAIAYDKNGITDFTWSFEYNSDNWGGVLFTTSGSGTLAALDLGFYEHNTYYEINVYNSFSGVIPGKLLTRQTGYARYAGWQTVPLDTGVRLAEWQDFFVSIRNLGQSDAIAYDFYSPDLGRTFTSANGSTFSPYKANINIRARIRTAEETEPELIKFKYNTGFEIYSSPAVGSDGTVYVGSADYYLYALNPYGTLKWRFGAMDWVDSSPALGSDGTIYAGSYDGYLYALNPNGTLKWKYRTDNGIFSSPALGSDGTVYAGSGDNYLYALNPVGTLKWKYKTGDFVGSSPAVGSDNTIYVGSDDSYLYALDSKGALKWRYKTGNYIGSSPAIGSDSTIYVGSADSLFYALNHNGTLKWKYQTEGRVMSSPAIDSDGTIYVGSYDSYLYALNPDGTLKWKYKTGDRIFSSPLISSGGIIYVGGEDSYLYALNSSRDLEWKFRTGGGINSSPSVGFDGMIYVGSNDGFLYALQREHDAALANSSWPKFGHDLQKTNNALHENLEPELSRSCDFNADGRINITDVIVFLVLGRIDPKDPQLDWNRDGKFTVSDAVKLLNDIQSGNCPGSPVMLASAGALEPVSGLAGLSPEELAYLEQMLEQMSLTPEQKAAFQEALYGESGRSSLPKTFSLSQNAPNPFNPSTAISFQVPEGNSGQVTLKVYDLRGSLVRTLVDGPKEAGAYTVFWDGRDREGRRVSSGVYLYRMQAASFTRTRKMVMLK